MHDPFWKIAFFTPVVSVLFVLTGSPTSNSSRGTGRSSDLSSRMTSSRSSQCSDLLSVSGL